MDRDRNLLFGIFAVQLGKIAPHQLVEIAAAWAVDPSRDLAHRLVAAKLLSDHDREIIGRLIDEAIKGHGGDTAATLNFLGGEEQVETAFSGSIVLTADGGVEATQAGEPPRFILDRPSSHGVTEEPGRYTLKGHHSTGGMGRIMLVHDQHLGREVAMKELLPVGAPHAPAHRDTPVHLSGELVARFLQEAQVTGQLEHPGIVPVYELGHRADGTLYYTMKLVRGKTLADALQDAKSLEARLELLPHFSDLCQSIAYAHSRGVIHRDIKPANVMVGEFGETIVIDWGLAKVRGGRDVHEEDIRTTLDLFQGNEDTTDIKTAYGQALGTPAYMAPEQAKGLLNRVDERSDVYGLGAVLYRILCGSAPYRGSTAREILARVNDAPPNDVTELEPTAPAELVAICRRAMQREQAKRYQSAQEVALEVQRFMSGALVAAYQYSFAHHLKRFVRRHKAPLATAAAALIVLAVIGGFYNVRLIQAHDRLRGQYYDTAVTTAQWHHAHGHYALAAETLQTAPAPLRQWEWYYLWRLSRLAKYTLTGHTSSVTDAKFVGNGATVVTRAEDHSARLWTLNSDEIQLDSYATLSAGDHSFWNVDVSADGRKIVTSSRDQGAIIWDAATGRETLRLGPAYPNVRFAEFSPDTQWVVTATPDGHARIWDAESGTLIHELLHPQRDSSAPRRLAEAQFSPNSQYVLTTVGLDRVAYLWDANSGELARTLTADNYLAWSRFSPKGSYVFARESEKTDVIAVYRTDDASRVTTLRDPAGSITAAEIDPTDSIAATGTRDGAIALWSVVTGTPIRRWDAHEGVVACVAFNPASTVLATCSQDKTIKLWNVSDGKLVATLLGHSKRVNQVTFSPDGTLLLSASTDATARVWDAERPPDRAFARLQHPAPLSALAIHPDGTKLLLGDDTGATTIWSPKEPAAAASSAESNGTRQKGAVQKVAYSQDGERWLADAADATVLVWSQDAPNNPIVLRHDDFVWDACFNSAGDRIASASMDMTVRVWNAQFGQEIARLTYHQDSIRTVTFDRSGRYVATASSDGTCRLWDYQADSSVLAGDHRGSTVECLAVSEDNALLASGDAEGWIVVNAIASGEEVFRIQPHERVVFDLEFSANGRDLLTASDDGSAAVVDCDTKSIRLRLEGHDRGVKAACYSLDGARIFTASLDGSIRVWDTANGREMLTISTPSEVRALERIPSNPRLIATIHDDGTAYLWGAGQGVGE